MADSVVKATQYPQAECMAALYHRQVQGPSQAGERSRRERYCAKGIRSSQAGEQSPVKIWAT